jgi:hypothetical protein
MGGKNSGRKPGSTNKQPDLEQSEIMGEGNETTFKDPPPEKDKRSHKKAPPVNQAEARQKINLVFGAIARLLGREYTYQDADFDSEAAGLVRLGNKFSIVNYVITLMDPVFMAAGLIQKFFKLPARKQKQAQEQQPKQPGQVVNLR